MFESDTGDNDEALVVETDELARAAAVSDPAPIARDVVFISKATPEDDEFVLWLAPKLEAAGYKVFADIRELIGGDRWRTQVTDTLQTTATKMLLCCNDRTLAKEGVLEEIEIAKDLTKSIPDPKFIIPLRLEPYKKVLGIGGLQYVDFQRGWAAGLASLLDTLRRRKVPRDSASVSIHPNWEQYRLRGGIPLLKQPERLTSNWLRITEIPDAIRHYTSAGLVDRNALESACGDSPFPVRQHELGFLTFAAPEEVDEAFMGVAKFRVDREIPLRAFIDGGDKVLGLKSQDSSNIVHAMFRQAWERFCIERGFLSYTYSKGLGFHASKDQLAIGAQVGWGSQGERRRSMLRNVAKGHVWQYGVSAIPAFWPFFHFKLKSRVLFAPHVSDEAGAPYDDAKKQHRLRRSVCKGWRNKQWRGRLMAFLELLSGDSAFIRLPLGGDSVIVIEAAPTLFTSPVSTALPNEMQDDAEELDTSTLGRPEPEEEEVV